MADRGSSKKKKIAPERERERGSPVRWVSEESLGAGQRETTRQRRGKTFFMMTYKIEPKRQAITILLRFPFPIYSLWRVPNLEILFVDVFIVIGNIPQIQFTAFYGLFFSEEGCWCSGLVGGTRLMEWWLHTRVNVMPVGESVRVKVRDKQ